MEKLVVITVGGEDLNFKVTPEHYAGYVNEVLPNDKTSASYSICTNAIHPDNREYWKKIVNPAVAVDVSGILINEYKSVVSVALKK